METMETHTANRTMTVFRSTIVNRKKTHALFFAGENDIECHIGRRIREASILLTQEQPEERIGSEEDPRWFCQMITIWSLNNLWNDSFYHQCFVSWSYKFKDVSLSVEDVTFQCSNHWSAYHCITTMCLAELVSKYSHKFCIKLIQIVPASFCWGDTWYHPELSPRQFLKKRCELIRAFRTGWIGTRTTSTRQSQHRKT